MTGGPGEAPGVRLRPERVFRLLGDSLAQAGEFLARVGSLPAQPAWPAGPLPDQAAHHAARAQVGALARWLESGGAGVHRMEDALHGFCARAWLDLSTHALYHLAGHPAVNAGVLDADTRRITEFIAIWSTPHALPGGLRVDYRHPRRRHRTPPRSPRQEGDPAMTLPTPADDDQPATDPAVVIDDLVDVLLDAGFTRTDPPVAFATDRVTVTIDHTRHVTVADRDRWEARFSPATPQVLIISALRTAGITVP
jgi:hypothetical protein